MAIYVTDEEQERVILVGVELDPADDCEKSLEELSELAKTAGAVTVGKMIQPASGCPDHPWRRSPSRPR